MTTRCVRRPFSCESRRVRNEPPCCGRPLDEANGDEANGDEDGVSVEKAGRKGKQVVCDLEKQVDVALVGWAVGVGVERDQMTQRTSQTWWRNRRSTTADQPAPSQDAPRKETRTVMWGLAALNK